MAIVSRRLLKRTLLTFLVLIILINVIVISQVYHLTHFYEHGTVPTFEQQSNGFLGTARVLLTGYKQQKIVDHVPTAGYSTIRLKTADGLTLQGWYIHVPNARGTVALFHGHGSEKSANLSQSDVFNEMGYSTFLLDFRAHGQSEGNTCTIGYRESEDVKLAYEYLQTNGEKHIILYGISLGAATLTKAIADYKLTPDKVILEMPFASLFQTVEGKMRTAHLPAEPLGALMTFWGGTINGFWAFDMKPKEFVKKIKCPVLLQWGKKDPGVSEGEMHELFANIPGDKTFVAYDSCGHQNLCECEPDKWEDAVGNFLGVQ